MASCSCFIEINVLDSNDHNISGIVKDKITSEMEGKLISIQLDLNTHQHRCILGVNTQYFADDKLVVRTLAMRRLMTNTSALNIAKEVEHILKEYGKEVDDFYTITTDNGGNVLFCTEILRLMQERLLETFIENQNVDSINKEALAALIDLETERISKGQALNFLFQIYCSAHTLELVLGGALSKLESLLLSCRNLIKNLRRLTIFNLIVLRGLEKPVLDCDTRWSSTFEMVSI